MHLMHIAVGDTIFAVVHDAVVTPDAFMQDRSLTWDRDVPPGTIMMIVSMQRDIEIDPINGHPMAAHIIVLMPDGTLACNVMNYALARWLRIERDSFRGP